MAESETAESSPPTLPLPSRSKVKSEGGRTPKKGGSSSKHKFDGGTARHKAWADFTPTPWMGDYTATPWSTRGQMMPPFNPSAWKDTPADATAAAAAAAMWPSTPTPHSWGSTPTPGGQNGLTAAPFGMAGMGGMGGMAGLSGLPPPQMINGMPMMPAGFLPAMAHMAEAAAASAQMAAAAAAAAQGAVNASSTEGSPGVVEETYTGEAYDDTANDDDADLSASAEHEAVSQENLASKGSALHGTEKCRPCAWFWKPQGCQVGKECSYCHMCPEGELKSRKKNKVAAMRMGALTPAKPGAASGAARRLKLTSLL